MRAMDSPNEKAITTRDEMWACFQKHLTVSHFDKEFEKFLKFDSSKVNGFLTPINSYSLIFPVNISLYITQSPMNEYKGRLKLAGLLCSKPKWPIHAQP